MTRQSHIASAVDELLAEREHLKARLDKVEAAIAAVRDLFHLPAEPKRPASARRTQKPPNVPSNGNGHDTWNHAVPDTAILTALQNGPMSPGQLATAVGIERANLRSRLAKLEANGVIASTGATSTRRIALLSTKEAP